jgi:hypothetical protein
MIVDNETAKQHLLGTLKTRRAVLLGGSGSSAFVGYPLWNQLADEMREMFAPHLAWAKDMSAMTFAGKIVDEIKSNNQLQDYYNFLDRRFEPRQDRAKQHDDFHVALVRLGFCGLVTTNYEEVIESAAIEAYTSDVGPWRCVPVDLCQRRSYRVFDFFRSLAMGGRPRSVLHLHGHHLNPEGIILTEDDYRRNYGEPPHYDTQDRAQNVILDSLHRKVLWTLFATHPLVFVGFSLRDGFFDHMMRVVKEDFVLGSDPAHYALMGATTDEDRKGIGEYLRLRNTMPVFYHVPEVQEGQAQDHSDLKRLINELAAGVGVTSVSDGMASVTRRMLEL